MTGHSLLIRIHEDASLSNHVVIIATVQSETECGVLCSHDPSCRSFNGCGNVKTIFIGKSCVHITVQLFELHVSSDGPYARYPLLPFITKDKVTPKIKYIAFLITMCLFSVRDINVCVNLCCTKKYYIEKYTSYTMMIRTFC